MGESILHTEGARYEGLAARGTLATPCPCLYWPPTRRSRSGTPRRRAPSSSLSSHQIIADIHLHRLYNGIKKRKKINEKKKKSGK